MLRRIAHHLRPRAERDERAFTLIELMVIVMIIGVLVTIGVVTFSSSSSAAQLTAARASARSAQTAVLTGVAGGSAALDLTTPPDATVIQQALSDQGLPVQVAPAANMPLKSGIVYVKTLPGITYLYMLCTSDGVGTVYTTTYFIPQDGSSTSMQIVRTSITGRNIAGMCSANTIGPSTW